MSTDFENQAGKANASQMPCWACRTQLTIPTVNGIQVPMFKCGWCGAISKLQSLVKERTTPTLLADQLRTLLPVLRSAFLGFVGLLLLSVPVLGFTYLLPNLYSGIPLALHMAWSLLLAANTYFNFAAAVLRPPGPVEQQMPPAATPVGKGAFDNCMYCSSCQNVKPPQAHHCSRCKTCVMDMDHHCIFLNNCVGRGNIRHFILLLIFLLVSCTYTFLLGCVLHWRRWDEAAVTWRRLLVPIAQSGRYWEAILVTPRFLFVAPVWQGAVTYLMSLTCGSCIGIMMLLASQLRLILRGQTYLESLVGLTCWSCEQSAFALVHIKYFKHINSALQVITWHVVGQAAAPSHGGDWQGSLRRIFGSEHPITWLKMSWDAPPGAAQGKKGD